MITLRPDQSDALNAVREAMRDHQSVLLRGACGWGKTVVGAAIAQGAIKKDRRVIFAVHRRELARQTALTFEKFGIPYGYIMNGRTPNPFANVQIASVDSLRNRPHQLKCDLFIPDEAHLWINGARADMIKDVRKIGANVIPLTATPIGGSGKSLNEIADTIVSGPPEAWLIARGHLAPYKIFAPASPDLAGIRTRMGEYLAADLEEEFDRPSVIGDAVLAYRKFAMGKRMIGYCFSRAHGAHMSETFNANDIPAAFIDGETPDDIRREVISKFADGEIWALFNVALFREGFDLSAQVGRHVPIQVVGLYNPTQSLPLAIQMMMRGMRPQDGHAVILDHVSTVMMQSGKPHHGLPDDEREWSLDPTIVKAVASGERTIATVICAHCFAIFRPQPCCPECGARREVSGREVSEVEGELSELDVAAYREHQEFIKKKIEERQCKTFEDWARLGKIRGHKPGWAHFMWRAKRPKVNA